MRSLRLFLCCFILYTVFIVPVSFSYTDSMYVWSNYSDSISTSTVETNTTPVDLALESGAAILIEQTTGKILYEHNSHEQLRPASVTKVMSILLIMESLDSGQITLTDSVPCSENAANMGGSQIWLDTRETLTVDEMLKAICVASANDYKVQLRHKKI